MPYILLVLFLLPIVAFLLILCLINPKYSKGKEMLHKGALITMIAFSAILVLVTEFLGVISRINAIWLSITWGIIALALTYFGWRRGRLSTGWRMFREILIRLKLLDWILLLCVASILVLLFVTGLVSPPNNVDVMQYHMPRVLQWIQNESLAHFPTIYDNQNTRPYFTELLVLNLSVLSGSDYLANIVQLFAAVGTMIAVAGIVSLLGGGRVSQWVAALFTLTLPMSLLQMTTPKDDVMAGFWIAVLLYFVVLSKIKGLGPIDLLAFGLSLGLGMLTKGTFIPFAFPIMLWYFLPKLRPRLFGSLLKQGFLILLLVTVLNGAFWLRNIETYGGPYGDRLPLQIPFLQQGTSMGSTLNALSLEGVSAENPDFTPVTLLALGDANPLIREERNGISQTVVLPFGSRASALQTQLQKIAQMAAMNLMTPVSAVNEGILYVLGWFPNVYPEGYRGMLREAVWNYANTAGNPVHFLLTSLVLIFALVRARKRDPELLTPLSLVAIAGYGLISFSDCVIWTVCMRYQLPVYVFGGVLLGYFVSKLDIRIGSLLCILFVTYSLPYVLLNNMRPVIGMKPWPTRIDSVFKTSKEEILFAHIPNFRDEYAWVADRIVESHCDQVGLFLKAYEFEYPFWWLLKAPRSGIRLQHVHTTPLTVKYQDPDFNPCAVICTVCQGEQSIDGLPLISDFGSVQYYGSSP